MPAGTFDDRRNVAKWANRKQAVIDRCARRHRESWARERNNRAVGRAHGVPR